jgi:hypothetical protein
MAAGREAAAARAAATAARRIGTAGQEPKPGHGVCSTAADSRRVHASSSCRPLSCAPRPLWRAARTPRAGAPAAPPRLAGAPPRRALRSADHGQRAAGGRATGWSLARQSLVCRRRAGAARRCNEGHRGSWARRDVRGAGAPRPAGASGAAPRRRRAAGRSHGTNGRQGPLPRSQNGRLCLSDSKNLDSPPSQQQIATPQDVAGLGGQRARPDGRVGQHRGAAAAVAGAAGARAGRGGAARRGAPRAAPRCTGAAPRCAPPRPLPHTAGRVPGAVEPARRCVGATPSCAWGRSRAAQSAVASAAPLSPRSRRPHPHTRCAPRAAGVASPPPPASEFSKAAAGISGGIAKTGAKLARLAALARKTSAFDDPARDIDELSSLVKHEVGGRGAASEAGAGGLGGGGEGTNGRACRGRTPLQHGRRLAAPVSAALLCMSRVQPPPSRTAPDEKRTARPARAASHLPDPDALGGGWAAAGPRGRRRRRGGRAAARGARRGGGGVAAGAAEGRDRRIQGGGGSGRGWGARALAGSATQAGAWAVGTTGVAGEALLRAPTRGPAPRPRAGADGAHRRAEGQQRAPPAVLQRAGRVQQ